MDKVFYITDAIDYANGKPHLGHALERIGSDALARYKRLKGYDVYFTVGTDEHAAKIEKMAIEQGKTPLELCDINAQAFVEAWKKLNISYDDFIRTTQDRHKKVAKRLFQKIFDNGFIYKAEYEGLYCIGCETYLKEKDLVDGKCPNHNTEPEKRFEENYFFALSKFEDKLLDMYDKNPDKFVPDFRKNEILNIIKGGLEDVSVSRNKSEWGIKLPMDDEHVIWVWFDALINYISVIGYGEEDSTFDKYWPHSHHIIGKDITRLHCIIWPAMLMAAGIEVPSKILAHGFVYMKGEKMSKSMGNVVNPMDVVEKYGPDPLRYYLMSEIGMIRDGDFTWDLFIKRFNSDLANDLGNLLHRTKNMVKKYVEGNLDVSNADKTLANTSDIKTFAENMAAEYMKNMDDFNIDGAVSNAIEIIKNSNKYIDHQAPWTAVKENDLSKVGMILYNVLESLRISACLLYPIIPDTSEKIYKELGLTVDFNNADIDELVKWGAFPEQQEIVVGKPLFPRIEIEDKKEEKKESKKPAKEQKKKEVKEEGIKYIDFDVFGSVDMRICEIMQADKHPDADRLLVVKAKVGEEEKQIVAGIADFYSPEELTGKKVIMVNNLKPVKLRGVESCGMLLAAKKGKKLSLITVDKDMPSGIKLS